MDAAASSKIPRKRKHWDNNHAAVLALDGGGIRGLVLVQMLFDLERRTGLKITQLFDWIGGTSTGSMLSLGMLYAGMGLRDVQQLYFGLKDEIFQGEALCVCLCGQVTLAVSVFQILCSYVLYWPLTFLRNFKSL